MFRYLVDLRIGLRLNGFMGLGSVAIVAFSVWVAYETFQLNAIMSGVFAKEQVTVSRLATLQSQAEAYNNRLLGVLAEVYSQPGSVEAAEKIAAEIKETWAALEATDAGHPETEALRPAVDAIIAFHGRAVPALRNAQFKGALYDDWIDVVTLFRKESKAAISSVGEDFARHLDIAVNRSGNVALGGAAMGMVTVGASVFIMLLVVFTITRPLGRITDALDALAHNDLSVLVDVGERKDEIGIIGRAIMTFRSMRIEKDRLEQETAAAKLEAERERADALARMADGLETSVAKVIADLGDSTKRMEDSAQEMSVLSEQVSVQSATVAGASEQAAVNVQTVASATEQLSCSVTEIGRRVGESNEVVRGAVAEMSRTDAIMRDLSGAVAQIDDVVSLIADIAGQTNLLALNATIEAARAGEAGKGFAVVANEVKSLASQTARATQQIGEQIANVQTGAARAQEAIRAITATVGRIDEIAAAIAAAVQQQGSATAEIARNIEQAATGTREVSHSITLVNEAAGQAGAASTNVLESARNVSEDAATLDAAVGGFLARIRQHA